MSGFLADLTLRPDYGWPALVLSVSPLVLLWAGFGVGKARAKYGIKYPQMYAEKSDEKAVQFNCYQRAHQNLLEGYGPFLLLTTLSAVHRPLMAAAAGAVRLAGFIVYVKGYQTGDPNKRHRGSFGYLGFFASLFMSIELGVRLILS